MTNGKHKCPVCKEHVFGRVNSWQECPKCGWVDDIGGYIWDEIDGMSENGISLSKARQIYKEKGTLRVSDEELIAMMKDGKVDTYDEEHEKKWDKVYSAEGYLDKKLNEIMKQWAEEPEEK